MCVGSGSETKQCMALEAAAAALEGCKQAQVCACSSVEQMAQLCSLLLLVGPAPLVA